MKVTFSGDICASVPVEEYSVDSSIRQIYDASDFNFACLEAPVLFRDLPDYKKIGPNLRQNNDSLAKVITSFSHVSLANNHSMDYGAEGLSDTLDFLSANRICGVGAGLVFPDMYQPCVIEKDGISVAVFCWAEAQYGCCKTAETGKGYAWMLSPMTYGLIQKYKKECDFVVLFLHAGLEDVEHPIMEWREQYRSYIDYGADLIIANHPHAIQGKEMYRGKTIYYSLGNFFFIGRYASQLPMWTNSLMVECDIRKGGITTSEHFLNFSIRGVSLSDESVESRFHELSRILEPAYSDEYKIIHDKMIMDCWHEYYRSYYSFPIFREKPPVIFYRRWFNKLMYNYVHRCFLPPVSENKLYHNINIDTHRFVVSRVCSMIAETY